ncbi:MAG: hypothetical protein LBG81_05680 [Coriobacteriaceae bacterium]|jgi:hypothetical protein|nr:hypothetical protein [Coriobacteriaceae bacterium]
MLEPEAVDWIYDCEWIVPIEEGKMGDYYIDETYKILDGAPDDVRERWEALCAEWRTDVGIWQGKIRL